MADDWPVKHPYFVPFWKRSVRREILGFTDKALKQARRRGSVYKAISTRMARRFAERLP